MATSIKKIKFHNIIALFIFNQEKTHFFKAGVLFFYILNQYLIKQQKYNLALL